MFREFAAAGGALLALLAILALLVLTLLQEPKIYFYNFIYGT